MSLAYISCSETFKTFSEIVETVILTYSMNSRRPKSVDPVCHLKQDQAAVQYMESTVVGPALLYPCNCVLKGGGQNMLRGGKKNCARFMRV